jgi:hypothetical protein
MLSFPKFNSSVIQTLRPTIASNMAMLMLLLYLCTQVHAVMHHHDDLGDHPDCSICAVAHHQSADFTLPIPFISPEPIITQVISLFTVIQIISSAPKTYPSRAPPL